MDREGLKKNLRIIVWEIGNFVSQLLHIQLLEINSQTIRCYGIEYKFQTGAEGGVD